MYERNPVSLSVINPHLTLFPLDFMWTQSIW